MPVTPTGMDALPIHYLRMAVADSAAFRAWVEASGTDEEQQAAALARIHVQHAEAPFTYPLAVVAWKSGSPTMDRYAGGAGSHFELSGQLELMLAGEPIEGDRADAAYDFLNAAGAIVNEILARAGTAGYLDVTRVQRELLQLAEAEEGDTAGALWEAVYAVDFAGFAVGAA